ncbi:MAG: hypothetical protein L6R38_007835 [Xanthoria sp. 2 TBL-2021]|nr:MAG: hypothetical protein L6R38_007835 [Xanthoria sp. 2 TBL-2021]
MATQYDSIVLEYDDFRKMPGALFEKHNVEKTLSPFLKGAKVLDLACGSGHYSNLFISWGASQVVGVDISPGMISNAKVRSRSDRLTFLVGDCSQPLSVPGGPFDIVFAGWLLNYAPDSATLTNMYRNISTNLKDGGRFFGVMQYPTEDPRGQLEILRKNRPQSYEYVTLEYAGDVEDGISVYVIADRPTKFEFKTYWLKESVHKEAAQQGGLMGEWKLEYPTLPEDDSEILGGVVDKDDDRAKLEKVAHFGLVMIDKE